MDGKLRNKELIPKNYIFTPYRASQIKKKKSFYKLLKRKDVSLLTWITFFLCTKTGKELLKVFDTF